MKTLSLALSLLLLSAGAVEAQSRAHLLIVSGLGGEPKYVEDFLAWGSAMATAAQTRFGVAAEDITFLAEKPERNRAVIDGESTKAEIDRALKNIATRSAADDRVLILLIGHGSADTRGARVNLPGPDMTSVELAAMLAPLRTQSVVIVNTASASGGWHEDLAAPNRTIVMATRSPMERNETVFGRFFVEAYRAEGADADRDGRVTIQEAFTFAARETTRSYETAGTLQLEHSILEGNRELAQTFHLGRPGSQAPANASPELQALFAQRRAIEDTLDALRNRRGRMEDAEYQAELERVLLELARVNRSIQDREGAAR